MHVEVPRGWQLRRVREVLELDRAMIEIEPDATYINVGVRSFGKGLFHYPAVRGSRLSKLRYFLVRPGCLFISNIKAWEGAVAVASEADQGCVASNRFLPYFGDPEQVDPYFLQYYFGHGPGLLLLQMASPGSADRNRTLSISKFEALPIALPPVGEQRKISAILASAEAAMQAAESVVEQARRVKSASVDTLIEGHGGGWERTRLEAVAEVRSGVSKNAGRTLNDPLVVSYLRVANVQDGYVDLNEVKTITIERSELSRYALRPGDVLMNEGGDIDKLGRGDVWQGQIEPCVHQNHVFSVRCGHRLIPRYLAYVAESTAGKRYFANTGKQTTNLASISKTQLARLPVPLPSVAEQHRIVATVDAIRTTIERGVESLGRLRQMKAGLLHDLLIGKVRVTP